MAKPPGVFHIISATSFLAVWAVNAEAQQACTSYTTKEGESLSAIAQAAYGSRDYQPILNANREVILASPDPVAAGTTLILPCADGRLTESAPIPEISAMDAQNAAGTTSGSYKKKIKLAVRGGWAGLADEDLPGGGLLVLLTETALHSAGNDRPYLLDWVNDRNAHLQALLPSGAYDISLPWYMPDCTLEDLSETAAQMCETFEFSQPLYDVI
ncbi:MAG: LysM peptidoglycan-binding domain-containing protein, partial [Alphaproteobacteria bacterium]|nr:LysM peptidoglycan-binding domain-containing protein [Alphaproteobacteria bacterium]